MTNSTTLWFEQLRKRGYRLTRQREAVLRALADYDDHVDAFTLHTRVQRYAPGMSLATVYRTLNLLKSSGLVDELSFPDQRHYEPISRPSHYHFICSKCGQIIEFEACEIESLVKRLARKGLRIAKVELKVCGVCHNCKSHK